MLIPGQRLNLNRLRKSDIVWLGSNHCRHKHTYLSHPNCYFVEKPESGPVIEKIGFCDIEANNLHATFGYIFSYCIKELDGPILERIVSPREIKQYIFDRELIKQFCIDIRKFDRVVVYWGKDNRYDLPFLRTRAVKWGADFPTYKELVITDVYDMVRRKLRLHRNRLETACDFLDIPCKEHRLNPDIWQKAMAGDKKALDYILKHNREDVISLEALWKRLFDYVRQANLSI